MLRAAGALPHDRRTPFRPPGRTSPPLAGQFPFSLFDAARGGTQVGATQSASGVSVSNGLFTVQLDFGTAAFSGAARWLIVSAEACRSSQVGGHLSAGPASPGTGSPRWCGR